MFNEMDKTGYGELNSALKSLIKNNCFTSFTVNGTAISPVKFEDVFPIIAGGKISLSIENNGLKIETINDPVEYITQVGTNYAVYNTGKIEQWGTIVTNGNSCVTTTFPIQFTCAPANINISLTPVCRSSTYNNSSPNNCPNVKAITQTNFAALLSGASTTWNLFYFATGK